MKNKNFAYAILILNAIAGWVSWFVLGASIYGKLGHLTWTLPILIFAVWAVVFSLAVIFVRNRIYFYGSCLAAILPYPLLVSFDWSILSLAVLAIFFALTAKLVERELSSGIRIHFYKVVSSSLKYFVTGVCVVAAVAYYFSLQKSDHIRVPAIERKTLELEIQWGLKTAGFVMPEKEKLVEDIDGGMTVDQYLLSNQPEGINVDGVLGAGNGDNSDIQKAASSISQEVNQRVQNEMLAAAKRQISEQLGTKVSGDERMKDVLANFVENKQNAFLENAFAKGIYLSLILALGLFLALRLVGAALDIFLGFFILGLIKIFIKYGAVSLKKEMREVGIIDYSI